MAPLFQYQPMGKTTLEIYNNLGFWAHYSRTIVPKLTWWSNPTVYFSPRLCIFIFLNLIPVVTPTLSALLLTHCLTKHTSFLTLSSSVLIPPDSPSLFSHPLVKCWGFSYLCLPGGLLLSRLCLPPLGSQLYTSNFSSKLQNHSSSCYPGPLDISTLIPIKFNPNPPPQEFQPSSSQLNIAPKSHTSLTVLISFTGFTV